MSITIRLDRPAVAALIESDPDFKYELQRNVISEVLRKFIDKDVAKIITAANPELMKAALDAMAEATEFENRVTKLLNSRIAMKPPGYAYTFKLTPEFQDMVDKEVERQLSAAMATTVNTRVEEKLADMAERIERQVDYAVNVQTAKIINEKVAARMAAITAAAAGA